jgi:hypothetical protein
MNSNIYRKNIVLLFLTFLSFLLLLFSGFSLKSHCDTKGDECTNIGTVPVPADSKYLASFIGAYLTFYTVYLLEAVKRNSEPKPRLEVSFKQEESSELVIRSDPHYIFSPEKKENIEFGKAYYLRVKITNRGDKIAHGCRGYLKSIRIKKQGGTQFEPLPGSEGCIRLLWAYEQKGDYRSTNVEQIPSGASEYLDVLLSYDHALRPRHLDQDKNKWFLKLKTQPQPLKYCGLLEIDRSSDIEYELTIEVYTDGCEPVNLSLVLHHPKDSDAIMVYGNNTNRGLALQLCNSSDPSLPIPTGYTAKELYDLL